MVKVFNSLGNPELIEMLRNGAVGILPTDTVYGLVASAKNPDAVSRIYALKHREKKPGTTIAASIDQLTRLGIAVRSLANAAKLWPNPISVILEPGEQFAYIHQGKGTSPFRVVKDVDLKLLLEKVGPLVTTSANLPGSPVAINLLECRNYFGDKVDFYVDGGLLDDRPASTIIRFDEHGEIEVIRQGALSVSKNAVVL